MKTESLRLLTEEREKRPDLRRTLDLYLALIATRAEVAPTVPADWRDRARARLQRGEAALPLDDAAIDWEAVRRVAGRICRIAAAHQPELALALEQSLARLHSVGPEGARAYAAWYLEGREAGTALGSEPERNLLGFLLNRALHPFLAAYRAVAAPLMPDEGWPRGTCPICAGPPDFAALEGEAGERRLLCARCDMEWKYRRLGCPFCGNEDSATLGYFPAADGAYRLYACDRCRGYLKTVDMRETWERRPLPAERILTVGLDLAAAQQGLRAAAGRSAPVTA